MVNYTYIMDSATEGSRLEKKTNRHETERQLRLVGLQPGMKVLDAGAGTGAVSRVIANIVGPTGEVTAFDGSEVRLRQGEVLAAKEGLRNLTFRSGNIVSPPFARESFDFVWCRFVFEYLANPDAAMEQLIDLVAPGGVLAISDLDGNVVFHDGMEAEVEKTWHRILNSFQDAFDPYAGRKLYRRFCQRNLHEIQVHCLPYHLYAGAIPEHDLENWQAKLDTIRPYGIKELDSVEQYDRFVEQFIHFLKRPDTFTYSILFLVRGIKS